MSDTTTGNQDARIFNFPRLGFRIPTAGSSPQPPTAPSAAVDPGPSDPPSNGSRPGRLSPLDALAALPDPGLTRPLIPVPAVGPQPGHVPATFRNEPDDGMAGTPGLGALSMAATLAVAIAALRGTHTVLSTWWENRQARLAEAAPLREARLKHQAAMQSIGDKAAQQRAKSSAKVPSSSEFGRKTLGSRSGSGSGGSSGGRSGGAGRSGSGGSAGGGKKPGGGLSGRGNGSSTSPKGGLGSKGRGKNNGSALGGGAQKKNGGTGTGGSGRGTKKPGHTVEPKPKKSPHRGSQGGSPASLKKQHNKNNAGGSGDTVKKNSGTSGTGLGGALKKDTQKAAARRWKKRQKNGADKPVLWGNDQKNRKNTPKTQKDPKASKDPKSLKKAPGQGGSSKPATGTGKNNGTSKQNTTRTGARTTLSDALRKAAHRAARKRLKQRRRTTTPPIWTARKNSKKQKAAAPDANAPKGNRNQQKNRGRWAKARAYARKKATNGGFFRGKGHTPRPGSPTAGTAGAGSGGTRTRRSPFENAGQAGAGQTVWTAERADYPGAQAKRWEPDAITPGTPTLPATGPAALDAAPIKTFPRPSTSRPKEPIPMPPAKPDARLTKARKQAARTGHGVIAAARHMDAQHATEITLDDALDEYGDFKDDGFKTHDQSVKLAHRAIKLRDTLALFAEDLAVNHNLIGPLFSGAMARMAESVDLVARMSEEMQISSLEAAEQAEAADNDLNDTYRPITQATADAGLTTPSAPIHNQT